MGKIYLEHNEIKKIYFGTNEVKKVYLGSTEVWSATKLLPSWFPQNVNGPADLESYYGADMSNYFVDVLYRSDNGIYGYARCYCDTVNALSIISNNMSPPTQLRASYSGRNHRVAVRRIEYKSDGSYYSRWLDNWSTTQITLMSQSASIFTPGICIIDWGNTTYSTSAPSGYTFEILTA